MLSLPPFFPLLPFFPRLVSAQCDSVCLLIVGQCVLMLLSHSCLFFFFHLKTVFAKFLKCVGNISKSANHIGMCFSIMMF